MDEDIEKIRIDLEQAIARVAVKAARLTALEKGNPEQDEEFLALRVRAIYRTYAQAMLDEYRDT